jgi:hypothetical protein
MIQASHHGAHRHHREGDTDNDLRHRSAHLDGRYTQLRTGLHLGARRRGQRGSNDWLRTRVSADLLLLWEDETIEELDWTMLQAAICILPKGACMDSATPQIQHSLSFMCNSEILRVFGLAKGALPNE